MTKPASLYLHLPFCQQKCHYCDFVVRVLQSPTQIDRYLQHLELELLALKPLAAPLQTLYLGGGTPSLLSEAQIERLCQMLTNCFDLSCLQEWTLEANPESFTLSALQCWQSAGVNRISLGVQSFDLQLLLSCGRNHTPTDIEQAVKRLKQAELNFSLDLIYGLPQQSLQSWCQSLQAALALRPNHLSLYALEVHPDTVFGHRNLSLPEDDETVAMYERACTELGAAGYLHYEIANWCLPGCESQHNQIYWQNLPFLAAGVGAHGYLQRCRYAHPSSLARYYQDCQAGNWAWQRATVQSQAEEIEETLFLSLRLLEKGLDLRSFERRFKRSVWECYPKVLPRLLAQGLVQLNHHCLRLNPEAVPVSNAVLAEFLDPAGC